MIYDQTERRQCSHCGAFAIAQSDLVYEAFLQSDILLCLAGACFAQASRSRQTTLTAKSTW